jgi:Fe(3+) dicitrate transport protein
MVQTKIIAILTVGLLTMKCVYGQLPSSDTLQTKQLGEVVIKSNRLLDVERLPKIQGTNIWSGKKTEVINVQNLDINIAEKTPRQIFAKIPGVFVYDMDGSGNQTNISTRGLDPHRGWEFNIRKNGIITNSDMYGYPASHYSMPMEAVGRIELVRGTGSLQFGAQFGGMLNYVTKLPDSTRTFVFESINSAGSFGLLSTYNAISGSIGKVQYYIYYNKRVSDGYRDNSHTDFDAQSLMVAYAPSDKFSVKAEIARSNYIYQIPGPLTDSMFTANPRQSTRERNYFNPEIYVPSISVEWKPGKRTQLSAVISAVLGARNSVQFDKPATVVDAIDPATLTYAQRQVDIDHFNSYTAELRLLHQYILGKIEGAFVTGIQVFNNDLHRQQLGKGTTGTDFDLTLITPGWGRDIHFKTKNVALFAENGFEVLPNLILTPGLRVEMGESDMSGIITYYDPGNLPNSIKHNFPLFGISADYTWQENHNFYAGWSQAYRPVTFKDIIPASTYEVADKDLNDAFGYNLEAGYRGSWKQLRLDVSAFRLQYNNRLGNLAGINPDDGSFYIFRTNIGNSVTDGLEIFAEYALSLGTRTGLSFFTSTAFFNSRYKDAHVRSGEENIDVSGNEVEAVPNTISRNGLTLRYEEYSISFLYSYNGESYADALNTVTPSSNGAVGLVPSYGVLDVNTSFRISDNLVFRVNLNNVTNKQYFTKRPTFYPGPGIWSSDGRSINCTVALKI